MAANSQTPQIAVVYLAWLPYGSELVEQFLTSYREHPAGVEHELVVVEKGDGESLGSVAGAKLMQAPDDGLDLATYIWTVRNHQADRYLFFNTQSAILADGWLEKFDHHLGNGVGIVGATGSHGGSVDSRIPSPNPHVRTNAFMAERELLLSLDWQEPILTKQDAYNVEHGPRSLTTQILSRGLEAMLVGRDGEGFPVRQWPESRTFWAYEQENLLIDDNATRRYMNNHRRGRYKLSRFAWPPW